MFMVNKIKLAVALYLPSIYYETRSKRFMNYCIDIVGQFLPYPMDF